jgi:acyl-CoA dehydrogenase
MTTLLWLLVLTGTILVLAYQRVGRELSTAVFGAMLLLATITGGLAWPVALLVWVAYLGIAALLNVEDLRQRYVTAPALALLRDRLPRLSATERAALDAGTVWWERELLSGRPSFERLYGFAPAALSAPEQAFLDGPVRALCAMLDDWQITHHDADLPPAVWQYLREQGFFGLVIPESYGGKGFSAQAHSEIVLRIATRSVVASVTVMVPNSLGPGELLLKYGTDAQKSHYLPRLARGEDIPCFALTGPQAGSDASNIPDTGVVCRREQDGQSVLGIRLTFAKRYITLGPVATVIALAFRLTDPERLLGEDEDLGITMALIPAGTPGLRQGERHLPLDIPFQNGPLYGEDVFVPLDAIIGGESGIGRGWQMLVECLAEGRGISLPAQSTAAAQLAARVTGAYARVREQFGLPIGRFEGVEEALARIAGRTYQMDAARRLTLHALDQGERPAVVTAIVKYHLTERMREVVSAAMDVLGGAGIMLGPRNLMGRAWQAAPISITVEGANILTRSLIVFGQGAVRAHPYLLEEMAAAAEPDEALALQKFDRALMRHAGHVLGSLARAVLLGLTRGRLAQVPGDAATRRYEQRIAWMSAGFALIADATLLTLGGALKRRERLSARLGDALSELYLATAVLHRYGAEGRHRKDWPLAQWALEDSLAAIQRALIGVTQNFPIAILGRVLRALVFPTGKPFRGPDDRLGHRAAALLLRPCETRERLTGAVFVADDDAPLPRLERALALADEAERVARKLRTAHPLPGAHDDDAGDTGEALPGTPLTQEESVLLARYRELVGEIVAVDAFPPESFVRPRG